MPHSAAAAWVSNSETGSTPQACWNATRSSLGLCISLSTAGFTSSVASASGMPGTNGSTSRMSPLALGSLASPRAICTSASCGQ